MVMLDRKLAARVLSPSDQLGLAPAMLLKDLVRVSIQTFHSSNSFIVGSVTSSRRPPPTDAYSEINENDEWAAIQKFNTLLHFEEQKQAMIRDMERKRLIREQLA